VTSWYLAELGEFQLDNESGIAHFESFASHRERLTELACRAAREVGATRATARPANRDSAVSRLCVLGAGNCNDLDLERLVDVYREVHLVDVDGEALKRAVERQPETIRQRITRHAPVDLSGMLDKVERWRQFQLTREDLVYHPENTAAEIERRCHGPFDVVLSACVLTQMQLSVLRGFGDTHRLFPAVTETLKLTHLRTLHRLLVPGGRAILATDLTSSQIRPLDPQSSDADMRPLMDEVVRKGEVFYVAHPVLLRSMLENDPVLKPDTELSEPLDAWLWQNGPEHRFLVYALGMSRKAG
jgi:hypothetical protein